MPTYKLTYFNITGLGEPIRFLLYYGGIEFEDNRITDEEWVKYKPETPMGQLPVLEIDGKKYAQSKAILRYLAKKCNLYGKDDLEALEIDAAADNLTDLELALFRWHWEENPEAKAKAKEAAFKKLPEFLDRASAQVKKNGGYFVGGKISYVDIMYAAFNRLLSQVIGHDMNKDHPELKKLVDKVFTIPKIKAYIDKRPKTIM